MLKPRNPPPKKTRLPPVHEPPQGTRFMDYPYRVLYGQPNNGIKITLNAALQAATILVAMASEKKFLASKILAKVG